MNNRVKKKNAIPNDSDFEVCVCVCYTCTNASTVIVYNRILHTTDSSSLFAALLFCHLPVKAHRTKAYRINTYMLSVCIHPFINSNNTRMMADRSALRMKACVRSQCFARESEATDFQRGLCSEGRHGGSSDVSH